VTPPTIDEIRAVVREEIAAALSTKPPPKTKPARVVCGWRVEDPNDHENMYATNSGDWRPKGRPYTFDDHALALAMLEQKRRAFPDEDIRIIRVTKRAAGG